MNKTKPTIKIYGAGLAGSEASYQLAKRGFNVELYEMKPVRFSPAHSNPSLAEIVCSNSFKSELLSTASGCLKAELELLDCLLLRIAKENAVPAGSALAIDREKFSGAVTKTLESFPNIKIIREEVKEIDTSVPTIIATGPLTSDALALQIKALLGEESLYFYDASAPIVDASSILKEKTFTTSRYQKGDSDYINCPMNKGEYYAFVHELVSAERAKLHDFEKSEVFEGCMPVEIMASRGEDTLRFGPLRPVGLLDNDGKRPYAVVQLRKENSAGELYNLVGFQTNLTFGEQKRVFSMIPALANADFVKYGVMHRNTFVNAPKHLNSDFSMKKYPNIYFAGQISGVEGYVESIMSGLVASISLARRLDEMPKIEFNNKCIIGAICQYLVAPNENFQPMNANFGILEPLQEKVKDKQKRKESYSLRAIEEIKKIKENYNGI